MNFQRWQEENDAWFSRADRFDGFDRGEALTPVRVGDDAELVAILMQALNEATQ